MKDQNSECIPKKMMDHKEFASSWAANTYNAALMSFFPAPLSHTRYAATPIIIYNNVHTGANTQLGGLKKGLLSAAYQVGMDGVVKVEPMNPAKRQTAIGTTNLTALLKFAP
jgi:hypothetical protein